MKDTVQLADTIIAGVGVATAIIGGAVTIYIYYRNSCLRRAEWLHSLSEKFYSSDTYREMRSLLDHERPEDIENLKKTLKHGGEDKLEEELIDYLNFFEFIASLWKLGQLPLREIQMMFQYYLCRIADFDFVMEYVKNEGFEGLEDLIEACKKGA